MARERRHLWTTGVGLFVACLAINQRSATVSAQVKEDAVPDKVVVRDKKDGSTRTYDGKLTLRAAGLQVLAADGNKVLATIHYGDIVKFTPGDMPGIDRGAVLAQMGVEDKKTRKDYEASRDVYAEMLKKAGPAPEPSKRYLEFKVAMMFTRVADETPDEEGWAKLAETAAEKWSGFLTEYKSGWELWPAARTGARLYAELNKFGEAARLWSRLSKNPELPPDLRLEAGIQEIDAQFRSGAYSPAAVAAKALADATPPGAAKIRLAIYEQAAKAANDGLTGESAKAAADKIEAAVKESADQAVRATVYGMIGELYLAVKPKERDGTPAKEPREAMWAFLWVETVFNHDKDEVLKAMCRLVEAFKAQPDEEMVKRYRERIRRFRANF
jgi:hypothetical protein